MQDRSYRIWLPSPRTQRTISRAVYRFPIHLRYKGKTIAICVGVATVEADENGIVSTWAIHRQERHDRWQNPLVLAYQFKALVDDGMTRAEVARMVGVSRARITQVMNLLKLHPQIQQYLMQAKDDTNTRLLSERSLRSIAAMPDTHQQLRAFQAMIVDAT